MASHVSMLEDQLKTASPEVIARLSAKVDELTKKVEVAIVPRQLSDHNKEIIKGELPRSKFHYDELIVFTTPDRESATYAFSFVNFFQTDWGQDNRSTVRWCDAF